MAQTRAERAAEVAGAMQAEHVAELEAALASARADCERLQGAASHLQARLDAEAAGRQQAQEVLARAQAQVEGLAAQLAREREFVITQNAQLVHALTAGSRGEPPAYEMDMTNRDANGFSRRIILKPVKG